MKATIFDNQNVLIMAMNALKNNSRQFVHA